MFNTKGSIDAKSLDELRLALSLTEHIKMKQSGAAKKKAVQPMQQQKKKSHFWSPTKVNQDEPLTDAFEIEEDFALIFPEFIWAVRDFHLELKFNGHDISPDEYLERSLGKIFCTN